MIMLHSGCEVLTKRVDIEKSPLRRARCDGDFFLRIDSFCVFRKVPFSCLQSATPCRRSGVFAWQKCRFVLMVWQQRVMELKNAPYKDGIKVLDLC